MSKQRKQQPRRQPLSPQKYITTRVRSLPLYRCLINKEWEDVGMANIFVSRRHTNGNLTGAVFLVDLLARGIIQTHYRFNMSEKDFFYEADESIFIEVEYSLAHNILYGAHEFAEEHGFKPHKDFAVTQYILEEDTDEIEYIDIEFGVDGQPVMIEPLDSEERSVNDFETFKNQDLKDFFTSSFNDGEASQNEVDALFDRWYHENVSPPIELPDISKVTNDPIADYFKSDDEIEKSDEIQDRLRSSATSLKEVDQIEKQLQQMIEYNPDNPLFYGYLAICSERKNNLALSHEIAKKCYERFPEYVFAKINYFLMLWNDNQIEEAGKVLGKTTSLSEMYPDRQAFHPLEILTFHNCKMAIALEREDMISAAVHFSVLNELDSDYIENSRLYQLNKAGFNIKKLKVIQQYLVDKGHL